MKEAFKSLEKYFKIPPLPPPYQGGEQEQTSLNSLCQEGINQNLPLDKGELEGVF
ncbi:MAG: hypothetical protein LBD88_04235 [Candidatus Peribacteria bacterium]|nr:hypothetical protein [Candidatus Peribacteria bacterium]